MSLPGRCDVLDPSVAVLQVTGPIAPPRDLSDPGNDLGGSGSTAESHTRFQYPDPKTVTTLQDRTALDDSAAIQTQQLYDGLGRLIEHRLSENASAYISSRQTYEALGRLRTKTNPSRPGDSLDYATTFSYDALGRRPRSSGRMAQSRRSLTAETQRLQLTRPENLKPSRPTAWGE